MVDREIHSYIHIFYLQYHACKIFKKNFYFPPYRISTSAERVFFDFTVFLKSSIAKMVATGTLPDDFLCIQFWEAWQTEYYCTTFFDETHDGRTVDGRPPGESGNHELMDEFEPSHEFSTSILSNYVKYFFIDKIRSGFSFPEQPFPK